MALHRSPILIGIATNLNLIYVKEKQIRNDIFLNIPNIVSNTKCQVECFCSSAHNFSSYLNKVEKENCVKKDITISNSYSLDIRDKMKRKN